MRQRRRPELLTLAFLFLVLLELSACDSSRPRQMFSGSAMGTTWSVQISEPIRTKQQGDVEADLQNILRDVDAQMSTYKPDSLLNQLNYSATNSEVEISAELFQVLALAQDIHKASRGAFDVTVGPLVALWGFGPTEMSDQLPNAALLQQARARIGMDAIELNSAELTASRNRDISIDLSAIAKGYAVDKLARQLYKVGYRNFLVEVGGELRGAGTNQREELWTIGIETPTLERGIPFHAAQLDNMSIATSGDYRNFREIQGERFSHTIDPRTGFPARHSLASVTVLHESAAAADAWATALSVLGPEQGIRLAEEQNISAYFIVRNDEGFESQESSAFSEYTSQLAVQRNRSATP